MTDRDRLIEVQLKAYKEWRNNTNLDISVADFTADYILADGWIRPPCKVGDVVYHICGGMIYELKITNITLCEKDVIYSAPPTYLSETDFGKTVFLTKEEAEKALSERK